MPTTHLRPPPVRPTADHATAADSTAADSTAAASTAAASTAVVARQSVSGFLFSPAIDLLFIANLAWPLLLLVDFLGDVETHERMLFWQIFFVTAPHRWITLMLVAVDGNRTADRGVWFIGLGVAIFAACLCLRFGTGSLLCLGAIDYVWNAWHFSSQHHGIFRIYQRRGGDPTGPLGLRIEKWLFRGFMLYVIARVAGWGWREGGFAGWEAVRPFDWLALAIPIGLVLRSWVVVVQEPRRMLASGLYLISVMTLFSALLLAAHFEQTRLVLQLALASAVFHSIEYLAIVSWSVGSDRSRTSLPVGLRARLFVELSRTWIFFLAVFIVVIGVGNYFLSRGLFEFWVLLNLGVAFCHYSFDGMIWKRSRRPARTVANVAGGA